MPTIAELLGREIDEPESDESIADRLKGYSTHALVRNLVDPPLLVTDELNARLHKVNHAQGGGTVRWDGDRWVFVDPAPGFKRGDAMSVDWGIA